jgi:hypothetical protein
MIVEIFGPPCSGKTTLAIALTKRLNDKGLPARTWQSSRPREVDSAGPRLINQMAFLQRLLRWILGMVAVIKSPAENAQDVKLARQLLGIIRPRSVFGLVRETQYICRLSRAWRDAAASSSVVVFDQGFAQEIFSLVRASGQGSEALVSAALLSVPVSDLFIRVQVARDVLKDRLEARRYDQNKAERLLESDPDSNFAHMPTFDGLHRLLLQRGLAVISVSSIDDRAAERSLDLIHGEITARFEASGGLPEWQSHS